MPDKLAIVTGSSGGIGAEIAKALSRDGFHIIAQYRSNAERANILRATIQDSGGGCDLVKADLSSMDGIHSFVEAVRERASGSQRSVSTLVNNAAKMLGPSFTEATPASFDEFVSLNTRAPLFLAQLLSRDMVAGASIVNISSASAHIASAGDLVYAMTKSALESLTRNMAEALAPRGIRVNAVVPGFTDNGHPAFSNDAAVAYMSELSMLGGVAPPSAVADAVSFLVSDKAHRTTGAILDVTGGMSLHPRPHRQGSVRGLV
ncbi:hypothetical protein ASF87_01090 [Microbacterium sp. Leaf161]|uniref:SDR family NAD(P)-dependent oxidoreductase n=1 Tax=Microbacterium sp. Leaf161 TaxID=1736281 RepID=UPI0006F92619|nr:SDR family oxidoreductase [Microbacterium sp. Leaf161]KQR47602.1 hypothetical protein ASF87_01090 [Microbacterium sp. Leaf161]